MAGSPKKRARKKAAEMIEKSDVCKTTRAKFREYTELFQKTDALGRLQGCIYQLLDKYQENSEYLNDPTAIVKTMKNMVEIYKLLNEAMPMENLGGHKGLMANGLDLEEIAKRLNRQTNDNGTTSDREPPN